MESVVHAGQPGEISLTIPDTTEIEEETSSIVTWANSLTVDSRESFIHAGEGLKRIAAAEKLIHTKTDPLCESTDAAHKAAVRFRADLLTSPHLARSVVSNKMTTWEQKERDRAAEAERQARAKIQAEEDERRLALAEKAEKIGDSATAQAVLDQIGAPPSRPVTLPVEAQPPPKIPGVGIRDNWKVRAKPGDPVGDLIMAAANNPALRVFLLPNYSALGQEARLKKDRFDVPGFEAWNDRGTSVRT